MILPTIARLQQEVDYFYTIEGAIELSAITDTPQRPAAFVVPMIDTAQRSGTGTQVVRQLVAETIGVVMMIRSRNDKYGGRQLDLVNTVRADVQTALLGWQPSPNHEPFEFDRGRLQDWKDGVVMWLDQYRTEKQIRST